MLDHCVSYDQCYQILMASVNSVEKKFRLLRKMTAFSEFTCAVMQSLVTLGYVI